MEMTPDAREKPTRVVLKEMALNMKNKSLWVVCVCVRVRAHMCVSVVNER